ncbi:MAG: hypothetical protein AB8B53_10385 [Flavobacteriales bacterium]
MRNVVEYNAVVFNGVVELENGYGVICNGLYATDEGNLVPLTFVNFSLEGDYINKQIYLSDIGYNLITYESGFSLVNEDFGYSCVGYKTNTGTYNEGFIASFDEMGDTLEVKYFSSPYLEEMGSGTNAPVGFCNSTNLDNSIFISSNILNTESGTGGDFYIQRMKPDGEVLWEYIYATDAQPEYCNALLPTENGGVGGFKRIRRFFKVHRAE